MTTFVHRAAIIGCIFLLSACASVQSTVARVRPDYTALPAAAVASTAAYVEQNVTAGVREPALDPVEGFIIDTPEVKQALRSRAARSELIQDILTRGHAFEKKNGKIAILRSTAYKNATTSRQRDRDALFIIMENRDRVIIYDSLTDANNLEPAARSAMESIFQQARIDKLAPGQQYEDAEGKPVAK